MVHVNFTLKWVWEKKRNEECFISFSTTKILFQIYFFLSVPFRLHLKRVHRGCDNIRIYFHYFAVCIRRIVCLCINKIKMKTLLNWERESWKNKKGTKISFKEILFNFYAVNSAFGFTFMQPCVCFTSDKISQFLWMTKYFLPAIFHIYKNIHLCLHDYKIDIAILLIYMLLQLPGTRKK